VKLPLNIDQVGLLIIRKDRAEENIILPQGLLGLVAADGEEEDVPDRTPQVLASRKMISKPFWTVTPVATISPIKRLAPSGISNFRYWSSLMYHRPNRFRCRCEVRKDERWVLKPMAS